MISVEFLLTLSLGLGFIWAKDNIIAITKTDLHPTMLPYCFEWFRLTTVQQFFFLWCRWDWERESKYSVIVENIVLVQFQCWNPGLSTVHGSLSCWKCFSSSYFYYFRISMFAISYSFSGFLRVTICIEYGPWRKHSVDNGIP